MAPEVRALAPDNSSASSHISMGGVIFAGAGSPSSLSARSDALNAVLMDSFREKFQLASRVSSTPLSCGAMSARSTSRMARCSSSVASAP